jgi:preflagellin peptidase FlaK
LVYASIQDFKTREIDDRIWIAFAIPTAFVTIVRIILETNTGSVVPVLTSILISSVLFFILGYLGFYGGADVKALFCITLAFPTHPELPFGSGTISLPAFPLTIFNNAILISLAFIPLNLLDNLISYRKRGNLFAGYSEPIWKKILILMATRKVTVQEIKDNPSLMASEMITADKKKKVLLWPKSSEENEASLPEEGLLFAHYLMPMIVPITIGFVLSLVLGDVLIGTVLKLLGTYN